MSLFRNVSYLFVRITTLISLLAASVLATQAQVVFSPPKNISNSSGNTQSQQIAVDSKGNINLVWADNSRGNYAIFFSRSSDSGATFSTPVSISKHARSTASGPQIIAGSIGNFSVVWTETSPDGTSNFIYFSHSGDGGATFTNPQNISGDAGAATGPRMAVDASGNVSIVWVDTSLGNSEIFFSRSADSGATFSTPLNISNDAGDSIGAAIAVDPSGNINIAWADDTPGFKYDVFFSRSTDGGTSFSSPLTATHSSEYSPAGVQVQVASGSNGDIDILWVENESPSVSILVFSRSTDGGITFSVTGSLDIGFSMGEGPGLAIDPTGSEVGIVGQFFNFDTDQENPFVFFGYSANAGASFSTAGELGRQATANPQILVDAIGRFDAVYAQSAVSNPFQGQQPACFCLAQSADGNESSITNISSFVPTAPAAMAVDPAGNASVAWLQSASSGDPASVFFSRATVPPFSFSLSPTTLVEGGSSTGTIKLISPAPAGGATISLSNNNAAVVSAPASVTVPEGASSATFTVTAGAVQSSTSDVVTSSFNGATNTATLFVSSLFQLSLSGNTTGGNTASGEVFLSQRAPSGGLVIALSSSDPSAATVPASVTVPAGSQFASFTITTGFVSAPTTVQITGTANGFSHSSSFTLQPLILTQLNGFQPSIGGGGTATWQVRLNVQAPAAAVVSLSSSNPSVASVPATVTVPQGLVAASFNITTSSVSANANVTISASFNGVTLTGTLTVQPIMLQELIVPDVQGGNPSHGVIILNGPAPAGGMLVTLTSSNPSISSVPATVTIPQGTTDFGLTVNTSPVTAQTAVTITASSDGVTLSTQFDVYP